MVELIVIIIGIICMAYFGIGFFVKLDEIKDLQYKNSELESLVASKNDIIAKQEDMLKLQKDFITDLQREIYV